MRELIDSIGNARGWDDDQKLQALCDFIDQMSDGETDAETFFDNYQPSDD